MSTPQKSIQELLKSKAPLTTTAIEAAAKRAPEPVKEPEESDSEEEVVPTPVAAAAGRTVEEKDDEDDEEELPPPAKMPSPKKHKHKTKHHKKEKEEQSGAMRSLNIVGMKPQAPPPLSAVLNNEESEVEIEQKAAKAETIVPGAKPKKAPRKRKQPAESPEGTEKTGDPEEVQQKKKERKTTEIQVSIKQELDVLEGGADKEVSSFVEDIVKRLSPEAVLHVHSEAQGAMDDDDEADQEQQAAAAILTLQRAFSHDIALRQANGDSKFGPFEHELMHNFKVPHRLRHDVAKKALVALRKTWRAVGVPSVFLTIEFESMDKDDMARIALDMV